MRTLRSGPGAALLLGLAVALAALSGGERRMVARRGPIARQAETGASGSLPFWFEPLPSDTKGEGRGKRGAGDDLAQSGGFLARAGGMLVEVRPGELTLHAVKEGSGRREEGRTASAPPAPVRLRMVGVRSGLCAVGEQLLPGKVNYLIGRDPSRWRRNVPLYGRVRVPDLYPGIDLLCYGGTKGFEYDFVVRPGADPGQIRLVCEGAGRLTPLPDGSVRMLTATGEFRQHAPIAYQIRDGKAEEAHRRGSEGAAPTVASALVQEGDLLRFRLAAWDRSRPLVIDPVITYSTYFGSHELRRDPAGRVPTVLDTVRSVSTDAAGYAYITGVTGVLDLRLQNPIQPTLRGHTDTFVAKLDPVRDGAASLIYCTYLGGNAEENLLPQSGAVSSDAAGQAVVTGATRSTDFPVVNPAQAVNGATDGTTDDAFVALLDRTGSRLIYSTYLGGSATDVGTGVSLDPNGNACVTGYTNSEAGGAPPQTSFPLRNALQTDLNRDGVADPFVGTDAFVARLSPTGGLLYATLLGGTGTEEGAAVATDTAGNAYVTGYTDAANLPTTAGVLQPNLAVGTKPRTPDAFVARVTGTGELSYLTYLGTADGEVATGIGVDATGAACVSFHRFPGADFSMPLGFVARLNATATAFHYAPTRVPGLANDVAVDATGQAFVASTEFGTTITQAVLTRLDPTGRIVISFSFGGRALDDALAVAVDTAGRAWVAGQTRSDNFPTVRALKPALERIVSPSFTQTEPGDGFVTRIDDLESQPVVTVAATDPAAAEVGPDPGVFTFTRAGTTFSALAVNVTVGGTAREGRDFERLTVPVSIPAGQRSATVTVNPLQDGSADQPPTTVVVQVGPGAGYDVGTPNTATVTIADFTNPAPPTNLRATVVPPSGIDLLWEDRSGDETQFLIERATGAGGFNEIARVNANVTTFQDRGLAASTAFTYRIFTVRGEARSTPSNTFTATTPGPPGPPLVAPTSVTARAVRRSGRTTVEVKWRDSNRTETGFLVERKVGTGGTFAPVGTTNANVLTLVDGAPPRGPLIYRVQALGAAPSPFSREARVTVR